MGAVRMLVLGAFVAGLGVALAGCGGSGAPAVAKLATTTASAPARSVSNSGATVGGSGAEPTGSGAGGKVGAPFTVAGSLQQMTEFAACMRANGEPNLPDPNAQGVISASLNRASPQVQQTLQACQKEMPGGTPSPAQQAHDLRQEVAFSACMRRNGVPAYPDPSVGGSVIHLANIDPARRSSRGRKPFVRRRCPAVAKVDPRRESRRDSRLEMRGLGATHSNSSKALGHQMPALLDGVPELWRTLVWNAV